ncbi:MAG: hypothetical protein GX640_00400 [Fibrobacter sp.]|nr:hypothetical protein [Fibrobacter sp.]
MINILKNSFFKILNGLKEPKSRMNKPGFFTINSVFFLFLSALSAIIPSATASEALNLSPEKIMAQIQTLDQKIKSIEDVIASYSNTLQQLILDSINIESEYFTTNQKLQNPISDFDIRLSSLTTEITELQKQISQARQDSSTSISEYNRKRLSLKNQISQLEQTSSTIKATIASLTISKQSLLNIATQNSDNSINALNSEHRTIDTLISHRTRELNSLLPRREQLVKDSAALVTRLNDDVQQAAKNIKILDSIISKSEAAVQDYSNQISILKQNHTQDLNSQKSVLQNYTSQKIRLASTLTQLNISITNKTTERQQLRTKIDASVSEYEKGRAPFVKQLTEAENTLNTRNHQKALWATMKDVFTLDSTIIIKRNELDELIQQAALKRKNATKLSGTKEDELNELMGQLDLLLKKDGVQQAYNQLKTLTLAQRRIRVYQVIANIDNDIIQQTAKKKQAEEALAKYERSNPMSTNPSVVKLKELDNTLTSLKNQKALISQQTDSLNDLINKQNLTINRSESLFKSKLHDLDSVLSIYTTQKNSYTTQRNQANLKNSQAQKNALATINQTLNNLKATNLRITTINTELQTANNRKEAIKTELANATEQFNQRKIRAQQDAQTTDATLAAKQQELANLSNQIKTLQAQDEQFVQESLSSSSKFKATTRFLDSCLLSKNNDRIKLNNQKLSASTQLKNANQSYLQKSMQVKSQIVKAREILSAKDSELKLTYQKRTNLINYMNNLSLPAQTNPEPQTPPISKTPSPTPAVSQLANISQPSAQTLQTYDSLIRAKEAELQKLQAQKNQMLQPAPAQVVKDPVLESQKIIEHIYNLIGENKNIDAYNLFTTKEKQLRANSPAEAVDMLKATFNEMPEIRALKR